LIHFYKRNIQTDGIIMMEINGKPLSSLRVVDLRDELDKRGLSKAGKKDELIQRLASWLEVNPEQGSESPQDDGEGGDGDDVIEAERQQAEKLRLEEEKRAEERRVAEEVKREEERKAAEVEKQAADLKKEEEEKWRQAEEEKKTSRGTTKSGRRKTTTGTIAAETGGRTALGRRKTERGRTAKSGEV